MTKQNTVHTSTKNNVVRVNFTKLHSCNDDPESKSEETLAEIFKRHKVIVPSDLIFKYK